VFTNQITGPPTFTVTAAAALHAAGAGTPLSQTVYVKETFPVTPGGGSNVNDPSARFGVTEPPAGEVALTVPTVNTGDEFSGSPGSVAPTSRPAAAGITIRIFANPIYGFAVATGASFTALIVIVTVAFAAESTVPSFTLNVKLSGPFKFAVGVYVKFRVQLLGTPEQLTPPDEAIAPFVGGVTIVNIKGSPSRSEPASVITFAVSSFVETLCPVAVGARFGTTIEQFAVAVCWIGDVESTTFPTKL
jgi:hypothetical protein